MNKINDTVQQTGLLISSLQNGEYFYYKALEAYRDQNITKAKRYLERAVQLKPMDGEYVCQLAIVLAELGDFTRSNECFLHIKENIDSEMSECSFFMANNYAHLGLFDHAKKEIRHYLKIDPDGEFVEDAEDLLELFEEDEELTQTLFEDEEQFLLTFELASQHFKNKHYQKAIELLLPLVKKQPTYWAAQIRLAEAYYFLGEKAKAVSILEALLENDNNNLPGWCHLMVFLHEMGNEQTAQAIFEMIKSVNPIEVDQRYLLAISFGKIGQHERAYHLLLRLSRIGYGDFPEFYHQLAVASYHTERFARARSAWKKVAVFDQQMSEVYCKLLDEGKLMNVGYEYELPIK